MVARLDGAEIANARMNDMHEVWEHAQLQRAQRWTEVRRPPGRPALMPPALPTTFAPRMDPVPRSASTRRDPRELGYDESTIARLRRGGAI